MDAPAHRSAWQVISHATFIRLTGGIGAETDTAILIVILVPPTPNRGMTSKVLTLSPISSPIADGSAG